MEIERRFWIEKTPTIQKKRKKEEIIQWYCLDPNNKEKIRIRKIIHDDTKKIRYTKTIKHGKWLVREEIESSITSKDWKQLRPQAQKTSLKKTRYYIPHKNHSIELNIFHENLEGIILAEVEFQSIEESKSLKVPERFWSEVTEYKESTSHYLAKHGKSDLEKIVKQYEQRIHEDLAKFYDHEAEKYTKTRKKHRAEADIFVEQIRYLPKKSLKILELGCGSGRLLEQLSTITDKEIDYTGIDISGELLKEANKITTPKNIKKQFIKTDMISFLKTVDQESYDGIIGIASIQHLPTKKTRLLCTKYSYRALQYWGLFIMSNWSFSIWFIKKYRKTFIETAKDLIFTKEVRERNSFFLPRKAEKQTFKRFYHIFTRDELRYIAEKAGFSIQTLKYINKQGELSENRKEAKNTLIIAEKNIFVDEKITQ